MRTIIFLVGTVLVILGPLLTLAALSSCLGTILSGHFLSCVTDFAYVVFGGVLFFVGIITAAIGAFVSDSPPKPPPYSIPAASPATRSAYLQEMWACIRLSPFLLSVLRPTTGLA